MINIERGTADIDCWWQYIFTWIAGYVNCKPAGGPPTLTRQIGSLYAAGDFLLSITMNTYKIIKSEIYSTVWENLTGL